MNTSEQLSIALVRYPYTNQMDYKIRPAVIISNNKFNRLHDYFITCPITSKKSLVQYQIEIKDQIEIKADQFNGKLKSKSSIRADNLASIEKELVIKTIGKITPKLFQNIKNKIYKIF